MFRKCLVTAVVVMSVDGIIAVRGKQPPELIFKEDQEFLKRVSEYRPCIMGRKTFEQLPGPLANRGTVVLSRQEAKSKIILRDLMHTCTLEGALEAAHYWIKDAGALEEIMIFGGAEIYEHFFPWTDRVYVTVVNCRLAEKYKHKLTKYPFGAKSWSHEALFGGENEHGHKFSVTEYNRKEKTND